MHGYFFMYFCCSYSLIQWIYNKFKTGQHNYLLVIALETWVFGAILAIVGFLVIFCSAGESGLVIPFFVGGLASASVGSLIFVFSFKRWIENISR